MGKKNSKKSGQKAAGQPQTTARQQAPAGASADRSRNSESAPTASSSSAPTPAAAAPAPEPAAAPEPAPAPAPVAEPTETEPAPTAASASSESGAVSLPPRKKIENGAAPVWSLQRTATAVARDEDPVPLSAKCDLHQRERTICCRELKGDDERALIAPEIVRDVIIGLADGLTVPFALTAGLSSLGSSRLVITAGFAELVSGAISMGIGGYLSAQAERDHFRYLRKQTRERVRRSCAGEMEREVASVLSPLGIEEPTSRRVAGALLRVESSLPPPPPEPTLSRQILTFMARRPKLAGAVDEERQHLLAKADDDDEAQEKGMTAFLLKFAEGLEETGDSRMFISAFTIGISYFLGGLIPLLPYFFFKKALHALWWSIGITLVILIIFGLFKTYYTGAQVGFRGYFVGAASTVAVGGAAAAASFGIVRALEGSD